MTGRAKRVIWFGFDGASRGFVEKFIAEGKMPALAKLRRNGAFAESLPVPPCDTPTNWSALQTGAHPGTTEVVSFWRHRVGDPLDVAHKTTNSYAQKADTIWEALERQGGRPIVINWPCSWPPRLKRGVQINGTGPRTASWRIDYEHYYRHGQVGARIVDPSMVAAAGPMVDRIDLAPADGWRNMPKSQQPPLEAEITLLGNDALSWSETGAAVTPGANVDRPGAIFRILVVATDANGYDRILIGRKRDAASAVELGVGDWSEWVRMPFPTSMLLEQLLPEAREEVDGAFRWKLIALAPDASSVLLYRTDIVQSDGWSFPPEVAAEITERYGPFVEGIEIPPFASQFFDEWGTYHDELDQARAWYTSVAKHLAAKDDWQLLALQLHIQDGINHVVARDISEDDPRFVPDRAAVAWQQLEAAYVTMDRIIDATVDALADDRTAVCVVSDHGALPTFREFFASAVLARAGLMAYQHDEKSDRWILDWSRTKVFPRRGHIWVNRLGRDPDGIVPDNEYEAVRGQAIHALLSIWDEELGTQPVVAALRKEDAVVYGMWNDAVGDIITFLAPLYTDTGQDHASLKADPLATPAVTWTDNGAAHHPFLPSARHGIWSVPAVFFLSGPGVKRNYTREHPISQVDVAPTLCHLLGIEPPAQCEGKIVVDALIRDAWDVEADTAIDSEVPQPA